MSKNEEASVSFDIWEFCGSGGIQMMVLMLDLRVYTLTPYLGKYQFESLCEELGVAKVWSGASLRAM